MRVGRRDHPSAEDARVVIAPRRIRGRDATLTPVGAAPAGTGGTSGGRSIGAATLAPWPRESRDPLATLASHSSQTRASRGASLTGEGFLRGSPGFLSRARDGPRARSTPNATRFP